MKEFYDIIRTSNLLGPQLSDSEVKGIEAILKRATEHKWPKSWTAYALATAYHETAATMQPIAEYGKGKGRKYGIPGSHKGQIAYGRGFVQLTWDYNYAKADKELNLGGKLINDYSLAMNLDIAAEIMVRGMEEGWFTGKSLKTYLIRNELEVPLESFISCRKIINGLDKAEKIAGYAVKFQEALRA